MARVIEEVLDLARWAPSGDNTQPWRFRIVADDRVVIHGFDTRDYCVYDLTGHPSQIAIGALLETLRIAATGFEMAVHVRRLDSPETALKFDVSLTPNATVLRSELFEHIRTRAVQRRPMTTRPLSETQKRALESSVGSRHTVLWLEGWRRRLAAARLLFTSAKIRLTTPEAFEVHRNVIEWNARFSPDKIPDQAIGLDPVTTRLMRWAMQDWRRVDFLNKYAWGTLTPRIELDFVPAFACGAHFLVIAKEDPSGIDDYIGAGAAVQRFWLTGTSLGLYVQPEMTPLIFSMYAREQRRFSARDKSQALARDVRRGLRRLIGDRLDTAVFMGRIGAGPPPRARSTRLPLEELMLR